MHIATYIDNSKISSISADLVLNGNPGIGGTEYVFLVILQLLSDNYDITIYSPCPIKTKCKITNIICGSITKSITHFETISSNCSDIYVANVIDFETIRDAIKSNKWHLFLWYHLDVPENVKNAINKSTLKITNIFLTKAQQIRYSRFKNIIQNSSIIPNPNISTYKVFEPSKSTNNVLYLGSIHKYKHVDILLDVWKFVVSKIPNSKLFIVGSGNIYDHTSTLGKNGIADAEYEDKIFNIVNKSNIKDSVFFKGKMDYNQIEKDIMPFIKVGVVNPEYLNLGETFCLSATQIGSYGIPVIGGDLDALVYTIPKKCGYRNKNKKSLAKYIIKLLRNEKMRTKYGQNYKSFIKNNYDVAIVKNMWIQLLTNGCIKNNVFKRMLLILHFYFRYIRLKIRKILNSNSD